MRCPNSSSESEKSKNFSFFHLFDLFRPSKDGMMPIYIGEGHSFTESTDSIANLIWR